MSRKYSPGKGELVGITFNTGKKRIIKSSNWEQGPSIKAKTDPKAGKVKKIKMP